MANATFKQGDKLATSSICDSECIFEAEVLKRTKCTVTIRQRGYDDKRCNVVHDDEGNEMIYPHGRYSMCTIYRANRDVQ
ncbi:MAG: hypothetical protein K0U20_08755 [Proteobacteria bacterium]|nr:hypothetical protein [Pseudomonadota bacterium]